MEKKPFSCEIMTCENGYLVMEGTSIDYGSSSRAWGRRWVADSERSLGDLIARLALEFKTITCEKCGKTK